MHRSSLHVGDGKCNANRGLDKPVAYEPTRSGLQGCCIIQQPAVTITIHLLCMCVCCTAVRLPHQALLHTQQPTCIERKVSAHTASLLRQLLECSRSTRVLNVHAAHCPALALKTTAVSKSACP
jgi:hypothetical protein